jgi:hypothetical protein
MVAAPEALLKCKELIKLFPGGSEKRAEEIVQHPSSVQMHQWLKLGERQGPYVFHNVLANKPKVVLKRLLALLPRLLAREFEVFDHFAIACSYLSSFDRLILVFFLGT